MHAKTEKLKDGACYKSCIQPASEHLSQILSQHTGSLPGSDLETLSYMTLMLSLLSFALCTNRDSGGLQKRTLNIGNVAFGYFE